MILQELIDTFEKLKQNIYLIQRGDKPSLLLKFEDNNFFHLVGLHKTNIDLFMPNIIRYYSLPILYLTAILAVFLSLI